MSYAILILVLFGNIWIWKIFSLSITTGLLVLLTSFFTYLLLSKNGSKNIFFVLICTLLIVQWQNSNPANLAKLSNDEQRLQQQRLRQYPPVYVKLGDKTLWIPLAHWFEGRKETIAIFRVSNNLAETLSPNLYFFANHPQERIGISEIEMFPYIFLPFFLYGLFLIANNQKKLVWLSLILPVVLAAFVDPNNPLGPFSLFPFISAGTVRGLEGSYSRISKMKSPFRWLLVFGTLVLFVLVLIQTIAYAIY